MKYAILISALFCAMASASPDDKALITAKTTFGHRVMEYEIVKSGKQYLVKYNDSEAGASEKIIDIADYRYLNGLVTAMTEPDGEISRCPRSNVQIANTKVRKKSCLGLTPGLESKANDFLRLLRFGEK